VTGVDDDMLKELLDRPFDQLTADDWMAIKEAFSERGIYVYNSASLDSMILGFLAGNIAGPFLQALSQRAANSVADSSKQVTDAVRKYFQRRGHPEDTPRIELPDSMTDEAWLALYKMVQANELRDKGKVLRWDADAMVWRSGSGDD
jgi:hypothetical protein